MRMSSNWCCLTGCCGLWEKRVRPKPKYGVVIPAQFYSPTIWIVFPSGEPERDAGSSGEEVYVRWMVRSVSHLGQEDNVETEGLFQPVMVSTGQAASTM